MSPGRGRGRVLCINTVRIDLPMSVQPTMALNGVTRTYIETVETVNTWENLITNQEKLIYVDSSDYSQYEAV